MAGIIRFTDTIDVYSPSLALASALSLIADSLPPEATDLARWLADIADRCAPCQDFDIRGLSHENREFFWQGVERANAKFTDWHQDATYSGAVGLIRHYQALRSQIEGDETSRFDTESIDLSDLWRDG